MKKRTIALVTALVLSTVLVAGIGAYLKYEVLAPYGIAQDKNIVELPFLWMTDEAMRYELELLSRPEDPTEEPTEPTTVEPTEAPTTEPPTEAPTTEPMPSETEHIHEYTATQEYEPTCEDGGFIAHICVCGEFITEVVSEPLGHSFEDVVVEPTDSEPGYTEHTCTVCGYSYRDTDATTEPSTEPSTEPPATDHVHTYIYLTVIEPTCTEAGCTYHECPCGAYYSDSEVEKLGHDYAHSVQAATCTSEGYDLYTCSRCGDKYRSNVVEKLAHDYVSVVVEPTETTDGYTEHTCSVCGDSYRDNYIYVDKPTEPPTEPPTDPPTEPPTEPPTDPPKSDTYPGYDFSGGVDSSWYDDVLFIGDSRTLGLKEYARSGNAEYFCGVGMSVFNVQTTRAADLNFEKQYLEDLLSSRTYGKVFINLGINECGYATSSLISAYKDLIKLVQKYQPNAKIVIQAIMTVSKSYSSASYFQPSHIFSINDRLYNLADGVNVFYIDVNPYFTDSNGYLYKDITGDGCHLYASYYRVWREWISYEAARLGI